MSWTHLVFLSLLATLLILTRKYHDGGLTCWGGGSRKGVVEEVEGDFFLFFMAKV